MNIIIESLFSNQNGIEFTWSNNGGEESEIEKMSKEDFAKLLCAESDGQYRYYDEVVCFDSYISEDETMVNNMSITTFFEFSLDRELDYCKECLVKNIQSQSKN